MIPPMTPDVSADATQAARERLRRQFEAEGCVYPIDSHAVRTILAALTAAEAQRDEAERRQRELSVEVTGLRRSYFDERKRVVSTEAQRDAALALAGQRLEALNDIREQADLGAASCSSLYRYAGEMNVETIDRDMMSNMLGEQFLVIRSRAAALVAGASDFSQQQQHDHDQNDES